MLRLPISIDLLACFYFRLRELIRREKFYHQWRTGVYSKGDHPGRQPSGKMKIWIVEGLAGRAHS